MTVSDVPVADASASASAYEAPNARVSTRARVRVPVTASSGKRVAVVRSASTTVRRDARNWWLLSARPMSLRAWRRTLRPARSRVPADSTALRRAWTVDNHTTGVVFRAAATALFLLAGGLAFLSVHPLRRWTALTIGAALLAWWLLG